jgi:hypothetical protein
VLVRSACGGAWLLPQPASNRAPAKTTIARDFTIERSRMKMHRLGRKSVKIRHGTLDATVYSRFRGPAMAQIGLTKRAQSVNLDKITWAR